MLEINSHTKLCGVIGNPVEHSLSPAIHNAAFQKLGLNYVYLAFKVENLEGAMRGLRSLGNLRGFSVTIPHKVAAVQYMDEVEPTARNIGAINTIVIEDGKLVGYNTDASGALRALETAGVPLQGKSVLLLGSGGAARAIAFALAANGRLARLKIMGIDEKERRGLVADLRSRTTLKVEDTSITTEGLSRELRDSTVVLHCTPLGMHPKVDDSCIPAGLLGSHLTVMDIVYNPLETRLLRDAKAAGCKTIRGLEMFLHQAADQFELWTGKPAPADVMRSVLESRFA